MDTAFCRIYHVECRGWVEQKRFALVMLLAVTIFLAASIVVPIAESAVIHGTGDLPFGLDSVGALRSLVRPRRRADDHLRDLLADLLLRPQGPRPWHGVWPGALFVTIAIGIGNAVFPVYLTRSPTSTGSAARSASSSSRCSGSTWSASRFSPAP